VDAAGHVRPLEVFDLQSVVKVVKVARVVRVDKTEVTVFMNNHI
jgi:hypothetical protein